ncbi:hypothetical protein [Thermus thermamylovorans]|uniref:Type II toxin-antitoxin system HicB family antitoxin n=1 Tax=Thermus thermamylovorans TaxID=2509362 RepID=A0A4Q9B7J1_9DEIN|nr:hypothetical protein [Thermus thermamylovorans]TBH21511.1 hypothetical protein ETP66_02575 [Thermus thermamylovorans]
MKLKVEVEYHPELEGTHEPHVARLLDYPELQGYGHTPEEAVQDALSFLEEHLGRPLRVLRQEAELEVA